MADGAVRFPAKWLENRRAHCLILSLEETTDRSAAASRRSLTDDDFFGSSTVHHFGRLSGGIRCESLAPGTPSTDTIALSSSWCA
jgi:hypothetical protein